MQPKCIKNEVQASDSHFTLHKLSSLHKMSYPHKLSSLVKTLETTIKLSKSLQLCTTFGENCKLLSKGHLYPNSSTFSLSLDHNLPGTAFSACSLHQLSPRSMKRSFLWRSEASLTEYRYKIFLWYVERYI